MLNLKMLMFFIFWAVLSSCTKESESTTKIIGTNSRGYANHKIRQLTILTTGETCTVTFIRPTGAITAGHCIPDSAKDFDCPLSVDGERPTVCGKITLDPNITYGLETVSRDIGFIIFSEAAAQRLHGGQNFSKLIPSDYFFTTNPTAIEIAGFGENFVRTQVVNGKYVPIKGGGDLTGIGRPGRPGSRSLKSCRFVVRNPSQTVLSGQEMIEIKPEHQQGATCMPTAGDSGGAIMDAQGNLIGIAIAVEYGPDRVERAVYLSLKSKSFQKAFQEFFQRLKEALGF